MRERGRAAGKRRERRVRTERTALADRVSVSERAEEDDRHVDERPDHNDEVEHVPRAVGETLIF